jgi:hypothetical protein
VLVRSTPSGARVIVDGEVRGVTPLASRDLSLAEHTIEVAYPGYDAGQRRVTLTARRPAQSIDFDLQPAINPTSAPAATADAIGALQITSRPVGAQVFVDDNLVGTTPLLVPNVSTGPHHVRIESPGHQSWSTAVQIERGKRFRVAANLEQ